MKEQIPIQHLKDILVTQYGLIFFPKRVLSIPKIEDTPRLRKLIIPGKRDLAMFEIAVLYRYLESEAVGDQWGSDHVSRRIWRSNLYRQFGEQFLELYHTNNQFRMNRIGLARLSMIDLGRLMKNASLHDQFIRLGREVSQALVGYNWLESLDDKLRVVHVIEDRAVDALNLLH